MIQLGVKALELDINATLILDLSGKLDTGLAISGVTEQRWTIKMATNAERMDRIESKIDKLSEVLVQMARVEEKLINQEEDHKILRKDIYDLYEKVGDMQKVVQRNQITVNIINRISWIIITGVVGGFGTLITYLFNK
jgi:F420-0:gamma-glutamyl ligase-like protein